MDVVPFQSHLTSTLLRTHQWLLISPVVSVRELSSRSYLGQLCAFSACVLLLALDYPIPSHFCLPGVHLSIFLALCLFSTICNPALPFLFSYCSKASSLLAKVLPCRHGCSHVEPPPFTPSFSSLDLDAYNIVLCPPHSLVKPRTSLSQHATVKGTKRGGYGHMCDPEAQVLCRLERVGLAVDSVYFLLWHLFSLSATFQVCPL